MTVFNLSPGFHMARLDAHIYEIDSFQGRFILKLYPYGISLDSARFQHWLLMALAAKQHSFRVPAPIRNTQGATFYTAPNDVTWVLSPKLEGDRLLTGDPDHAYAAGVALGELHRSLADLPLLDNPDYPNYSSTQRTLPATRTRPPQVPADLGLADTNEALHRLQRFQKLTMLFRTPFPQPGPDLQWHLVHGDFTSDNLLYDGEQVMGVLDFWVAHPDYRVREFVDVLFHITGTLGTLFWGTARTFVEGYNEHCALTRREIALVPEMTIARYIDTVMQHVVARQPVHASHALREQEEISAWLEVESDRLKAMLRGVFLGE